MKKIPKSFMKLFSFILALVMVIVSASSMGMMKVMAADSPSTGDNSGTGSVATKVTAYTYDGDNNLVEVAVKEGAEYTGEGTYTYTFNVAGSNVNHLVWEAPNGSDSAAELGVAFTTNIGDITVVQNQSADGNAKYFITNDSYYLGWYQQEVTVTVVVGDGADSDSPSTDDVPTVPTLTVPKVTAYTYDESNNLVEVASGEGTEYTGEGTYTYTFTVEGSNVNHLVWEAPNAAAEVAELGVTFTTNIGDITVVQDQSADGNAKYFITNDSYYIGWFWQDVTVTVTVGNPQTDEPVVPDEPVDTSKLTSVIVNSWDEAAQDIIPVKTVYGEEYTGPGTYTYTITGYSGNINNMNWVAPGAVIDYETCDVTIDVSISDTEISNITDNSTDAGVNLFFTNAGWYIGWASGDVVVTVTVAEKPEAVEVVLGEGSDMSALADAVDAIPNGGGVDVVLGAAMELPADFIPALAAKDGYVSVTTENNVKWSFDSLTNPENTFTNPAVELGYKSDKVDSAATATNGEYLVVDFKHDGALPGTAKFLFL